MIKSNLRFIYLHGFASSPQSQKASIFKAKLKEIGVNLIIPDLEAGDFKYITISKQMKVIEKTINQVKGGPVVLVGSSMGGYLAILASQIHSNVKGLYLMCPGLNFLKRWRQKLLDQNPKINDFPHLIRVFHYRYNKEVDLDKGLFEDALQWEQLLIDKKLPIRIVHGINDETVPIEVSRKFSNKRPWVSLKELESDHSLLSHISWIIEDCILYFCRNNFLKNGPTKEKY